MLTIAQPHRKPTVSSGTRQESLTASPHPPQPHNQPNPERDKLTENPHALLLVSSQLRQLSLAEFPLFLPAALQKSHIRTSPASQKAQPRKGQTHRNPTCIAVYLTQFPPAQPHRKPGTRQDSFTESLHENQLAQPLRKPSPERDRLTESRHAELLSILPGPPAGMPRRL